MKTLSALVLAFALTAPTLAHAQEPAPPPPAAPAPLPPPALAPAAPPPLADSPPAAEESYVSDARPSRGVGLLVAGGIFTGIGVVNLATAPICKTDLIKGNDTQDACLIASLVLGGTFIAIGVPLLVVGGVKRGKFKQWQAEHPMAAGLGFSPTRGGGALTLGGQF